MGRPKAEIVLNESEREQLEVWTRRRKTARRRSPHGRGSFSIVRRVSTARSSRNACRCRSRRYRNGVTALR
jgi:hypothetical protein